MAYSLGIRKGVCATIIYLYIYTWQLMNNALTTRLHYAIMYLQ